MGKKRQKINDLMTGKFIYKLASKLEKYFFNVTKLLLYAFKDVTSVI